MHDANEMECLIFENVIKNILLRKVTKSGVSDANNKLIITIFQMWGHIDPIRSGIGLRALRLEEFYSYTEKIQQKRTRKTKQNKGKLCTANNYIQ